jgi:peptidoglycan/LPS O-acetylase OafA/YrhL
MVMDAQTGAAPITTSASAIMPVTVGRRLDVQGLRAVAVLLVVAYHAGLPLPGGFVGVDVFFVISGFVITAMLQREWTSHGRIRFGHFYLRRFKRLIPALALMVAVTVLLSTLFLSPLGAQQSTAQTAVGAMFLLANAVIARTTGDYFDAPAETNALLHTWSLSVEEQFYLGFPLLLAACWWLARRRGWERSRVTAVVVGASVVVSLGIAVAVSRGLELQAGEMLVGFYGPLTRVWEFGVGALLVLRPGWTGARTRVSGVGHGALGVVLLVASLVLISGTTPFPGVSTILPVVATALLIRSGGRDDNVVARLLQRRSMVRLGDWSYSIYLWHWPFIVFAGALWPNRAIALVVAAVVSVVPAIASYTWVEEPLRSLELKGGGGIARLVVPVLAPPVVLALFLGFAVDRGFWSPPIKAHQDEVLAAHSGCYGFMPLTSQTSHRCTLNPESPGPPIYLVGDSHAQHFSEAVQGAGAQLGRPVVVSTATNCPVLDIELTFALGPPGHDADCRGFARGTMAFLSQATPGVVVLASSDRYWSDDDFAVGTSADAMTRLTEPKLEMAGEAIATTVVELQAAGHEVLLVEDVPRWDGVDKWTPTDCTVVSLLSGVGRCERQMPTGRAEERQGAARAVLREVASSTGAQVLDPWTALCPRGWCATHAANRTNYRDTNHITVSQSKALAPNFVAALDGME